MKMVPVALDCSGNSNFGQSSRRFQTCNIAVWLGHAKRNVGCVASALAGPPFDSRKNGGGDFEMQLAFIVSCAFGIGAASRVIGLR